MGSCQGFAILYMKMLGFVILNMGVIGFAVRLLHGNVGFSKVGKILLKLVWIKCKGVFKKLSL